MANTIDAYITQLTAAGFIPNAAATLAKRDLEETEDTLVTRGVKKLTPDVGPLMYLLDKKGFEPARKRKGYRRDFSDLEHPSLATRTMGYLARRAITLLPERALGALTTRGLSYLSKREIPPIELVISCLERRGFYPSGIKVAKRSEELEADHIAALAKRQSAGEINTVINQLMVYGYNPEEFGPEASKFVSSYLSQLPVSKTAVCPAANNTIYSDAKNTYMIICAAGYGGNDLPPAPARSFQECLDKCSNYVPNGNVANGAKCVAATYFVEGDPNAYCHMKYAIQNVKVGGTTWRDGRQCGRVIAK